MVIVHAHPARTDSMQVTKLEQQIGQLRSDVIEKDDLLVEAVREKAAGDEDAASNVKRLRGEKKVLQAQLECKTRQLKVASLHHLHFNIA